ncbi:DNA methyltransferase 1-associated protein 1 [Boothiomyces sp. JEL0838]|nr:DNA methyltransferase 1-associated protein 1 [Boothiomyces sp. JEL0838]
MEFIDLCGGLPPLVLSRNYKDQTTSNTKWEWKKTREHCNLHSWTKDGEMIQPLPTTKVLEYTDEEYELLKNPNWTREETDELMQLVQEYNHRFHIVKDRFSVEKSMVDIKQRYFQINRTLLNHREKKKGFIFDASREAKRIENIERLINRTQEELDNEELLYSQIKQRSHSSYDDRLYKIMSFNLEATNSIGEKSANLKKKKVKKEGVYLASRPLLKQQKIAAVLEEYGYKPIRMPSVNVMEHYETLHSNICILLDLKKSIDKMQLEIRNSDGLKKRTHTNVYHTPRDKKQRIN